MSLPEVGSLALAVVFGAGGVAHLAGARPSREAAERLGLPYSAFLVAGAAQVLGALGLLAGVVVATWIGIAAAIGLAVLAACGLVVHVRKHEPAAAYLPAVVLGAAAVAVAVTL